MFDLCGLHQGIPLPSSLQLGLANGEPIRRWKRGRDEVEVVVFSPRIPLLWVAMADFNPLRGRLPLLPGGSLLSPDPHPSPLSPALALGYCTLHMSGWFPTRCCVCINILLTKLSSS